QLINLCTELKNVLDKYPLVVSEIVRESIEDCESKPVIRLEEVEGKLGLPEGFLRHAVKIASQENNRQFYQINKQIDLLNAQIELGKNLFAECSETSLGEFTQVIAKRINPLILERNELRVKRNEISYIDLVSLGLVDAKPTEQDKKMIPSNDGIITKETVK